jgi:ammonia channel protein AmtB
LDLFVIAQVGHQKRCYFSLIHSCLIFEKPSGSVTIIYAILIALVAITPASGFVTVGGAMVIAIFAYLFTIIITHFIISEGFETNAPISVVTIHGVAGSIGFFWTAILSYTFVNEDGSNGLTYGRGIPLGYHIAFLLALWSVGIICVALLAFACNLLFPIGNGVIPPEDKPEPTYQKQVESYDIEMSGGGGYSEEIIVNERVTTSEERYIAQNE